MGRMSELDSDNQRTAHRVTEAQAKARFRAGDTVVVSDRGGETVIVSPMSVTHDKSTTTWEELSGLVEMWRNRYPNQRYYVVTRPAPAAAVKTWADGFGRWYAAVPGDCPDPRRRAREAIRRELGARGELVSGARIRVERAPEEWHSTADPDARPVYREANQ